MTFPFFIWNDVVLQGNWNYFWIDITTIAYWIRGGGVWFVGTIIPLYFIVPWWHKLLNGKKRSWIPSLIVFIALMCFGSFRHLGEVAFFFAGYEMGKHVKDGKIVSDSTPLLNKFNEKKNINTRYRNKWIKLCLKKNIKKKKAYI